jgi:mono/diheme cytochrome c family protein
MNNIKRMSRKLITICMFPLVLTACGGASEVSFSQDVKPILDQNCSQCHQAGGEGEVASGFNMATYDGLIKGAKFGPMIIAGDAEGSNMLVLMEGRADPSISMPHGQNESVSKQDIQTIRSWIEQGAKNN